MWKQYLWISLKSKTWRESSLKRLRIGLCWIYEFQRSQWKDIKGLGVGNRIKLRDLPSQIRVGLHEEGWPRSLKLFLKTEVNRDVQFNGNSAHSVLGILWKWHNDSGEREMGTHHKGDLLRNLLLGKSMKNSLGYLFSYVYCGVRPLEVYKLQQFYQSILLK